MFGVEVFFDQKDIQPLYRKMQCTRETRQAASYDNDIERLQQNIFEV